MPAPAHYDQVLEALADYLLTPPSFSEEAYATATLALFDAIACSFLALQAPECRQFLSRALKYKYREGGGLPIPWLEGELNLVDAAFALGILIRWLDYNDTWLALEWGHPSDNLAAILAVGAWLSQQGAHISVKDILEAMIMAYEIQGILSLSNSLNSAGYDHVHFVKVAAAGVTTRMLGGGREAIMSALSHAWIDGAPLRVYRHAPNTGARKSWAAGDAASRGLFLATLAQQGEEGCPSALTVARWGVQDVLFSGKEVTLAHPLGCYVMEHILFKVSFPAEFHAQTAVEAALLLHSQLQRRYGEIVRVLIETQAPAQRIIDKSGPLLNFADRDHCLQYAVAFALLHGELTSAAYSDEAARDPRLDALRAKMKVEVLPAFDADYLDHQKRSIANALTIYLKDGSQLGPLVVEYPLGHRRRRQEALPLLIKKIQGALLTSLSLPRVEEITKLIQAPASVVCHYSLNEFLNLLA